MAKSRAQCLAEAGQALLQQNFGALYENARNALALGSPVGAVYLCAYYHSQVLEGMKSGFSLQSDATFNFCTMYAISDYYKVAGYADFTPIYKSLLSGANRLPAAFIQKATSKVIKYTQYLDQSRLQYLDDAALIDAQQIKQLVINMEQFVMGTPQQALEVLALPHNDHAGYGHPQADNEHSSLLGHQKCWEKVCVIL